MKKLLAVLFLLVFLCDAGFADVLKMKSGQYKRGRIVTEDENQILFDSDTDGAVVKVLKSEVSIMERDVASEKTPRGTVSYFSTVSGKRSSSEDTENTGSPPAKEAPAAMPGFLKFNSQEAIFGKMEKMVKEWISDHPEMKQWFQDLVDKQKKKSEEIDKVAEAVKTP